MNRFQYWLHELLDRLEDLQLEAKIRLLKRYSRRRLAAAFTIIIFILYVFFSGSSSENPSTVKQCVNDRLRHWSQKFDDIDVGIDHSAVEFLGNGYVGVDSNGELRVSSNSSRVLDTVTGFYPFVTVTSDSVPVESVITDFKNGILKKIQCYLVMDECVCVLSTLYAHRTRKNVLMQEIQITNPTRGSLDLKIERKDSSNWEEDTSKSGVRQRVIQRNSASSVVVATMCSKAPGKLEVTPRREETFRFTCAVDYVEANTPSAANNLPSLASRAVAEFSTATQMNGIVLDKEHTEAWNKIHDIGFHLSHSKAPMVLNSDKINATKYAILSNIRAPVLEVSADPVEKQRVLNFSQQRERCYSGHSNLLYPSRLWEDISKPEQLVKSADLWLLTLDKRGCSSLIKSGATGFAQAFVLSLTACSFHDGHLEMSMAASDLHREMSFSGVPIGTSSDSTVTVRVIIESDNRPYLEVSASDTLYACDGGCLDPPVTLGKTFTRMPIKVTKPATSILYVASSRKHLEQLKAAIHVSEVGAAPAHEEDVLSLHRTGSRFGGLPTSFWVFLGVILIAFHAFLAKLLWSEWRKGDMTPYNPYLRNRYSYARSH